MSYKKKKINSDKSNRVVNTVVLVFSLLLVFTIAIMVSQNKKAISYNHIKEISYSDYLDKIKDNTYTIILLATPDCQFCVKYKPFMNQVAVDYDLEVNYIDLSSNDLKEEEYIALHDQYSVLKDRYDDNIPIIPTPTTIIVKKGKEVASRSGNLGYDGFVKLLKESGVI